MEGKIPLSVVILTKNEAGRIKDCIESVRWADDVLVIDDESTDETVQIAQSLGARVLRRKMDIEGRHRNWAYAQAKHEWVLSLDADERVSPELAQEMRGLLSNPAIGPRPSAVGRMVEQEHSGGRDVAPIGAGVQAPRAVPVGLHTWERFYR